MVIIKLFSVDIFNNPQPFNMYLCKPNGIPICQLNGIDIEDASINIRLNNQYELSFKYFK